MRHYGEKQVRRRGGADELTLSVGTCVWPAYDMGKNHSIWQKNLVEMCVGQFNLVVTTACESIGHHGERENGLLLSKLWSLVPSHIFVGFQSSFPCCSFSTQVKISS